LYTRLCMQSNQLDRKFRIRSGKLICI